MKKKLLALVTGAALLAGTVSIPAYASANVSLVDITQIVRGTNVTIQGQSSFADVLVKVIRPDNTILYFDDLMVTNGNFLKTFTLPTDTPLGQYKIVVGQDTTVATDTFDVIAPPAGGGGTPGGGNPGGGNPGGGNPGDGNPGDGNPGGGNPGDGNPGDGNPGEGKNPTVPVIVNPGQSQNRVTPKTTTQGNTVKASITDADLQKALSGNANSPAAVVVTVGTANGQTAELTLSPEQVKLLSGATGSTLVATKGNASVALPASVLNRVQDGATVVITIGADADATSTFTSQVTGASIVGTPVSYEVNLVQDGKSTPIDVQSQSYIKRSFVVDGDLDTSAAGVLYIENGVVSPVPATFTENEDGTVTVVVNRPGFSTYAVATRAVSFADIDASYAKDRIQTLANKFLLYGTSTDTFSPQGKVTRAEFAAMLGRALGLKAKSTAPFADVQASDWFAKDVAAVYEAGLVQGVGNGQFNPNAEVTRQDLTVMLAKAIELINLPKKADAPAVSYSDANQFASYAKGSIQTVTERGLMTGELVNGSYVFHPTASTTREAAATVLYFLLKNANLIN